MRRLSPLGASAQRWGGNHTSLYNWLADSGNDGHDNFYVGGNGRLPDMAVPGKTIDDMVAADIAMHAKSVITVPLTGWVNRDSQRNCSFAQSAFPDQDSFSTNIRDFQLASPCGIGTKGSVKYVQQDVARNHLAVNGAWISAWASHLKDKFGPAGNAGIIYQMDNEPESWPVVHQDVHPLNAGFDELLNATFDVAGAIKSADPTAQILGPSNCCGWGAYGTIGGPGASIGKGQMGAVGDEQKTHGGVPWAQYYLTKMRDYEAANGVRILDYLDFHYYPSVDSDHAPGVGTLALSNSTPNAVTQAARLRATRALWDPTYIQEDWQGDFFAGTFGTPMLIRKMKAWVNQYYPGTKTAITEYNWGGFAAGAAGMNGAIAQADVLGIFGREGLDLATLWGPPSGTNRPGYFAFRMFLDYDGAGSQFGDISVAAASSHEDVLSVYGAQRGFDGAVTLMVINKTAATMAPVDLTSTITIQNFTPAALSAQVYQYSASDASAILRQTDAIVTEAVGSNRLANPRHTVTLTFPSNSITLMVIPGRLSPVGGRAR